MANGCTILPILLTKLCSPWPQDAGMALSAFPAACMKTTMLYGEVTQPLTYYSWGGGCLVLQVQKEKASIGCQSHSYLECTMLASSLLGTIISSRLSKHRFAFSVCSRRDLQGIRPSLWSKGQLREIGSHALLWVGFDSHRPIPLLHSTNFIKIWESGSRRKEWP